MKPLSFAALILLVFSFSDLAAWPIQRGLKLLDRGDYEKTQSLLLKQYPKEQRDPAWHYLTSRLLSARESDFYSPDSAYYHCRESLGLFETITDKERKQLEKFQINKDHLTAHRQTLDRLAFAAAQDQNTRAAFEHFIALHQNAAQLPAAIAARNQLAFAAAESQNTYPAYEAFMRQYPDAAEITMARERYDARLFEAEAGSGRLSDLQQFIAAHPESPFRRQILSQILHLSTLENWQEQTIAFIKTYPGEKASVTAQNGLYAALGAEQFIDALPPKLQYDSLRSMARADKFRLVPFLEDKRYGFVAEDGTMILKPKFKHIPESYRCEALQSPLLLASEKEQQLLINRHGKPIFNGTAETFSTIGGGYYIVETKDGNTLIHQSGNIIRTNIEGAGWLENGMMWLRQNGKAGLLSHWGKEILPVEYEAIRADENFLYLKSSGKWAILSLTDFLNSIKENNIQIQPAYDGYTRAGNEVIVQVAGENIVFDHTMQEKLPAVKGEISKLGQYYLIKSQQYTLVSEDLHFLYDALDDILYNNRWIGIKKEQSWALIDHHGSFFPQFSFDSIRLMGSEVAIAFQHKKTFAFIGDNRPLDISNFGTDFFWLQPSLIGERADSLRLPFFAVKNRNQYYRIYNTEGENIFSGKLDKVQVFYDGFILIEQNGKKGLLNKLGEVVVPVRYSGIGSYHKGTFAILEGEKFGIYDTFSGDFIKPAYDQRLTSLMPGVYAAKKDGAVQLVTKSSSFHEEGLQELVAWRENFIFARIKNEWRIISADSMQIVGNFAFQRARPLHEGSPLAVVAQDNKYGIYHYQNGIMVPLNYQEITNMGTAQQPIFVAEKDKNDGYQLDYFAEDGRVIHRSILSLQALDLIICE